MISRGSTAITQSSLGTIFSRYRCALKRQPRCTSVSRRPSNHYDNGSPSLLARRELPSRKSLRTKNTAPQLQQPGDVAPDRSDRAYSSPKQIEEQHLLLLATTSRHTCRKAVHPISPLLFRRHPFRHRSFAAESFRRRVFSPQSFFAAGSFRRPGSPFGRLHLG